MPRKKKTHRQQNGSGKPIQVSAHSWRIEVALGLKPDGKRDRRYVFGQTPEEAQDKARDLQLRHGRGLTTQTSTVTFGEWLEIWLEGRKVFLEVASVELYMIYQRLYIPQNLKAVKLQGLRVNDFKELDAHLVKKELTRQTRAKVMGMCRQSLREAILREFIVMNPCDAVKVQATRLDEERRSNPVDKALTDAEMDTFLTTAEGHELEGLLYTMFSLGLRIGEGLGLRWSDLDFENHMCRIEQQVKLAAGKWVLGKLKTARSRRRLPMSEDLCAKLEAHRWAQDEIKHTLGKAWHDHGLVFASAVGTPRDKNNVNKQITKIRTKAGVRAFSSHGCRHTRLTSMMRKGTDAEIVAKYAGHSSSTITRTTYRTVFDDELPTVSLKAEKQARLLEEEKKIQELEAKRRANVGNVKATARSGLK